MIEDRFLEGRESEDLKKLESKKLSEKRFADAKEWDSIELGKKSEKELSSDNKAYERQYKDSESRFESAKEIDKIRDIKAETIEKMVQKDFPLSQEKRIDNTKDLIYMSEQEFLKEIKSREPFRTEKQIDAIAGIYYKNDGKAFVKEGNNASEQLLTSIHEKLHQKSLSELPTRLNEGITEYFARDEAGEIGRLKEIDKYGKEIPRYKYYEKEAEIVQKLEAVIGREPLESAYFKGNNEELIRQTDAILGNGAFEKITKALEVKDYKSALDILENYYKKMREI